MSSTDNYESAVKGAAQTVAEFEEKNKGWIGHFHHALHVTPSLVPLIVLITAIIVFGLVLGSRFFSPFALTLILQQVQVVGVLAAAQTLIIPVSMSTAP